jgi:hypothetical protein
MEHLAVRVDDKNVGDSDCSTESSNLVTLLDCFGGTKQNNNKKRRHDDNDLIQISFNNKSHHFRRLHQITGIPYEEMVFFDNEYCNIRSVAALGVRCIYTPDGMMKHHWDEAKRMFAVDD